MILNINDLVEVQLLAGIEAITGETLDNPFFSYFTAEMSPLYSSTLDIRRLVGAYITEIPDDVLNQLILEWSFMANDLATCTQDAKWLRYANKWVTYKVSLIIMYNTEEFRGSTSDKVFKQLGDFSISKGGGSTGCEGVTKLIDWLECEAFKYEFSVRDCVAPLMNCLGLTDNNALPYTPKLAELAEKGVNTVNKPIGGRRWMSFNSGHPRGNNTLVNFYGRNYKTNLGT